jgi:hypothetical protein
MKESTDLHDIEKSLCYEYVPTLSDRFWRFLGFRAHFPEPTEEMSAMKGWIRTDTAIRFSAADRLRLLVSGRALLRVEIATSEEPGDAVSVSSVEIRRPFQPFDSESGK